MASSICFGRTLSYAFIYILSLMFCILGVASAGQTGESGSSLKGHVIEQHDQPQTFEFATIKPVSPRAAEEVETTILPKGKLALHKQSLKSLICMAFNVGYWQIAGNDSRLLDYYDVDAQALAAPDAEVFDTRQLNGTIEDERLRLMLQALLLDRFQLKFHHETRTSMVYALELSGKPLRLTSTMPESTNSTTASVITARSGTGWILQNVTMPELARYLSNFLGKPLINRSGLHGAFDFTSQQILTDDDFHVNDVRQTLIPALSEMGLKIEKTIGPVDIYVVDRVGELSAN